ncbi:MAG: hypothetical protein J7K53_09015 [Bacteroidales bacterium]|nr:hypothetical protein [Bacteroidales bacterium]
MKAWILENQAPVEKKPLMLKELPDPHPKPHEMSILKTNKINNTVK